MIKVTKTETTKKRDAQDRIVDFHPIYHNFNDEEAKEQSSRCLQCPVEVFKAVMVNPSYCRNGCPLNNKIPFWLKKDFLKEI